MIFNGYVSLPEGTSLYWPWFSHCSSIHPLNPIVKAFNFDGLVPRSPQPFPAASRSASPAHCARPVQDELSAMPSGSLGTPLVSSNVAEKSSVKWTFIAGKYHLKWWMFQQATLDFPEAKENWCGLWTGRAPPNHQTRLPPFLDSSFGLTIDHPLAWGYTTSCCLMFKSHQTNLFYGL